MLDTYEPMNLPVPPISRMILKMARQSAFCEMSGPTIWLEIREEMNNFVESLIERLLIILINSAFHKGRI